jgi:mRNA-degrading endonuclease RelE of RelBE toxin-antitoxin system
MYQVLRTDTFRREMKRHQRDGHLLQALDEKLQRLREAPLDVGGWLHGDKHGLRSTRIARKYRLLFSIDQTHRTVTLEALDHRDHAYD